MHFIHELCHQRGASVDFDYWRKITKSVLKGLTGRKPLVCPARAGSGKSTWITAFLLAACELRLNNDPLADVFSILLVLQKIESLNSIRDTIADFFPNAPETLVVPLQGWTTAGQQAGFCKNTQVTSFDQCPRDNCTYAASWAQNGANTAWGALVYKNSKGYHEAQCSGYSRGFKALCDGMGVPCRYVHANSKSYNPSHQWNEVRIGKKWYIIDPQCNANYGVFSYFLCSGKTYTSQSGMKWDTSKYPKVASKDYSRDKIIKVYNGYKITRVCKKLFK